MKKQFAAILMIVLFGAYFAHAEMEAYSADNTFLGYVVAESQVLTSNNKFVQIQEDGTIPTEKMHFLTTNCTGTPYMETKVKGTIYRNQQLYYEAIGNVSRNDTQSSRSPGSGCGTHSAPNNMYVIEAQEISESLIPFSLPVDMPLTFKVSGQQKAVVIPLF